MPVAKLAALDPLPPSSSHTGFISDLLVRCGHGDEGALVPLLDIFYPIVLAATASKRTTQDADEAVKDVFLSIWREAPSYHPNGVNAVDWIVQLAVSS